MPTHFRQNALTIKGSSDAQRAMMTKALRLGKRIDWRPDSACRAVDVDQLSPCSWHRDTKRSLHKCITVVIPTHRPNPAFVDSFANQAGVKGVLLLSNGNGPLTHSTAKVLQTPWLGHGGTRLLSLNFIETPYVFFTVDDALAMQNLFEPLIRALSDPAVDAVCARQIPWPDSDRFTRHRLSKWTPAADAPYPMSHADHVGTLYRTNDLRRWHLCAAPIAEDAWWTEGRHTLCVPSAVVMHAHKRKPIALYSRERSIGLEMFKMNIGRQPPSRQEVVMSLITGAFSYGLQEGVCAFAENWGRRRGLMGK